MPHSDPSTVRQSNGYVGEHRTVGILARYFIVLKSSIDRDGADFIIDFPTASVADERTRARNIRAFGIIQAKFFERGNAVYIESSYSEEDGRPRKNFFLFLHTDDENGAPIFYFLDAEEVCALPVGENGKRRFSIVKNDRKTEHKDLAPIVVSNRIRKGMEAFEKWANDDYQARVVLPLRMRAGFNARNVTTEYILKQISLPINKTFPYCDARVVFARSAGDSVARPIDARWDLYKSAGTWSWGYKGERPKLLAMSILAHYLGWNEKPTHRQHIAFLLKVVAQLDQGTDHTINGSDIETAIFENDS